MKRIRNLAREKIEAHCADCEKSEREQHRAENCIFGAKIRRCAKTDAQAAHYRIPKGISASFKHFYSPNIYAAESDAKDNINCEFRVNSNYVTLSQKSDIVNYYHRKKKM